MVKLTLNNDKKKLSTIDAEFLRALIITLSRKRDTTTSPYQLQNDTLHRFSERVQRHY